MFGKNLPERVVISKSDFTKLKEAANIKLTSNAATQNLDETISSVEKGIEIRHRNLVDEYEVSVDERVRQAEAAKEAAEKKLEEINKDMINMKNEKDEAYALLEFFPDYKERTKKARAMENAYQTRWSIHGVCYISYENKDYPIREFIKMYIEECKNNDLKPWDEMVEHLRNLIAYDRSKIEH